MQLDKLVIPSYPKTSWQCFDLGFRLAISQYPTLFLTYLFISLPFFLVGFLFETTFVLLIFWLFKPWYERALLYILSRAVFDTQVSIKEAIITWPSQIKPLWFSSVTYRRLNPSRSFDMAVTQLEKLEGSRRSKRLTVLHRTQDDNSFWLTMICAHWEVSLFIGFITLAQLLMPQEFYSLNLFELYIDENYTVILFSLVAIYIAAVIVAPFYIAGGFVAYLNRRVILEAWDIELSFKKWCASYLEKHRDDYRFEEPKTILKNDKDQAEESEEPTDNNREDKSANQDKATEKRINSFTIAASLLFICSQLVSPNNALAQSKQTENISVNDTIEIVSRDENPDILDIERKQQTQKIEQIKEDLEEIYNQEPFGGKKTVTRYRFKYFQDEETETQENDIDSSWYDFLRAISKGLASIVQVVFWGLFVGIFAYIVYRNWSSIGSLFTINNKQIDDIPLPSFISKSFDEKLPNDVVLAVNDAIEKRDYRRALSLLVRASLTKLSERQEIRITKSMTENECLYAIKLASSVSIYHFMQGLMQQWMRMAWAHQLPSNDELMVLVKDYEETLLQELDVNNTYVGDKPA